MTIGWRRKQRIMAYVKIILAMIVALWTLFPVYWMVLASFIPDQITYGPDIVLLPLQATLDHYSMMLAKTYFFQWYANSLIVAGVVVIMVIPVASAFAYVTTRFGRVNKALRSFGPMSLFLYMIPSVVLAVPIFIIFSTIGLADNLLGLALANATYALPLSMWLLWGFFSNIPYEVEEAALVDGASRYQSFFRIMIPIARPGITAVAIFSFITVWLDYLFALTLIRSQPLFPVALGITWLLGDQNLVWGQMMAAATLVAVPSFIIGFVAFKYLIRGFEMALKGA